MKNGIFIARPNRFIAHVEMDGKEEVCHVKNTGRCKELLIPGTTVYVQDHGTNTSRKTRYSLIGVRKGERLINMDSQAPNKVVMEWLSQGGLFQDITFMKAEQKYGNSRFDVYVETPDKKIFVEVKGVTLEEDGIARFPDAPTERGVKHVYELCHSLQEGYEAYIVFVIQMENIHHFEPNYKTHKAFQEALIEAEKSGVHMIAMDCKVGIDTLVIDKEIPIVLNVPE